eukprot:CAMPEP_0174890440 /NCGR_PEP_ID=MMETSP0167-20121228/5593_1 /TAXON_ID=38298 /ORGANISM="Rhodella maculata, Strain CCMP736" /LENGTH=172 /DNA_ID=CAMNT_0016128239 /DNA_START=187 /DNA_END=705 /DNA_ORIENTATION=+
MPVSRGPCTYRRNTPDFVLSFALAAAPAFRANSADLVFFFSANGDTPETGGGAATGGGAGGGGGDWMSANWSNTMRKMSNVNAVDDIPTKPLPENYDFGDGQSDFSNWLELHEDTSIGQALVGLGSFFAIMGGLYWYAGKRTETYEVYYTPREVPNYKADMGGLIDVNGGRK